MAKDSLSRRRFIQLGTGAVAASTVAGHLLHPNMLSAAARRVAPSDTIRFASIGTGVRGCEHLEASLSVPGIQCVGVCDLYDGRHTAAREAVNNPSVPASRDYRTILDRKDVDSVLIATMDHQHRHIFEDACAAGKDVYCEKPMSHNPADGLAMVAAAKKTDRIVQIGAQRTSSVPKRPDLRPRARIQGEATRQTRRRPVKTGQIESCRGDSDNTFSYTLTSFIGCRY